MCGIVGFIGKGNEGDLSQMVGTLHHRGPDDTGVYCADGVGLGHARLAIIDLTPSGHQPMWNESHTIGIVFNGEIYNFQELKKTLVEGGRKFVSTSDTEVIIALYEKFGEECFSQLNGMFAIALFDAKKTKLLLARDRMGKKPLYYGVWGDTLLFGSEPKALLAHPLAKKEIDMSALNQYLALDYVPTPLSIWSGMKKLEPATLLVYQEGKIRKAQFWTPDFRETTTPFPDALVGFDQQMKHAVSSRLVSDVPLGIFLSGGLDSSAVAYYAGEAKRREGERIHTFSIGFKEKEFDESKEAVQVAKHLDTIHHHQTLEANESLGVIPKIFSSLDEPHADASIIPTYLLSKFAKEHVTVALGGDGGDELFAGYPTFQAERMMNAYRMLPKKLRCALLETAIMCTPTSFGNFNINFNLRKTQEGAEESNIEVRHERWLGTFGEQERAKLFRPDVWNEIKNENVYAPARAYMDESTSKDELNRLLWVYQRTYMMDQVLVKVDRASMLASLETRAPFLDYTLVEFVNRLPYKYKLHGMTTKFLLKQLMHGKLPAEIINRKKKGFGIPVGVWLRGPLQNWGGELIANISTDSLINKTFVEQLWNDHQIGRRDNRKKLWNVLAFLEWQKNYL